MKTKTYLRYISCVLAVLLCVASIMPIAFADSTNHGNSESLLTGSNYSVSYSMNGKDVVEQLTIRDGGITRITRTVHPNDVMDIVVVGASGESTTSTARSDYACSMKFIKISKITKTDSWHKFLHSLEAR